MCFLVSLFLGNLKNFSFKQQYFTMNPQHERRSSIIKSTYFNEFHVTLCAGPTIVKGYFF